MFARSYLSHSLLAVTVLLLLGGCQGGDQASSEYQWQPMFGDFAKDNSQVVARAGDIEITANNLQSFLEEQPPDARKRFAGPEGERLAVNTMINEALTVQDAIAREVYRDPDVARTLISLRRNTLAYAMRNVGLKDIMKPSEEELRQYYLDNKNKYIHQGRVQARHIECLTREAAQRAYDRIVGGGFKNQFPYVVFDYSVNTETKAREGEIGWFSKSGSIPYVRNSKALTEAIYDLEVGLHPPIQVGDRWHVVEIARRKEERPQTFVEARDNVHNDMLPAFRLGVVADYLQDARQRYDVELFGRFAPGQGLTADELFARAMAITDLERKVELLTMLHADYPDSPKADDALFMAAYSATEAFTDLRIADRLLRTLLTEYPDSELVPDAQFLRDNLYNPGRLDPQKIEDLRQDH